MTTDQWKVIHGNCLDVLRSMPDNSFDAVVTDPPYGIGMKKQTTKYYTKIGGYASYSDDEEETIRLVTEAIIECRRVAKVVVLTPGTRILQRLPVADEIGTVFMAAGVGVGRWGFQCNNPIIYYGACPYMAKGMGRRPNSVSATGWNRRKGQEHPCEKPEAWMVWMVNRATIEPGQSVLDPFCGSGTTGVACIRTGRRFVGIEIDAGYCEIARRRLREEVDGCVFSVTADLA